MLDPIYLCGPTASGKSTCALALAKQVDGEIINADAFQIYRGLEILTAAPDREEKLQVPHHLYSAYDLNERFDAARFEKLARPIIAQVQSRGKVPIIVGGSGLYLKFLTHGRADAPPGDETIRAELDLLAVDEIFRRLHDLDPASDLRKNFEDSTLLSSLRGCVLNWDRDVLAERIAQRTSIMLEKGAIEEVDNLPEDSGTVRQAIGVKEIEAHLRGELSLAQCQERIIISTRQYAKRQRNWFRRETWLTPIDASGDIASILAMIFK